MHMGMCVYLIELIDIDVVAGRISLRRSSGAKIHFYDIETDTGKLQVVAFARDFDGDTADFKTTHAALRKGDLVEVKGYPGRTNQGEISLFSRSMELLAPCWHDIPDALENPALQSQFRHVHMLVNQDFTQRLIARSRIISAIRSFLVQREFVEVETPILQAHAGGASARPFTTHAWALGGDLSLRIAPELYLKRLIVGGLPRVFEIGKVFRNEGLFVLFSSSFCFCFLFFFC
eukprot:m.298680 g.298680  ORF g.298680 m.298680 type:complete len:233 (+) comp15862_c0_seq21:113-811(+)